MSEEDETKVLMVEQTELDTAGRITCEGEGMWWFNY